MKKVVATYLASLGLYAAGRFAFNPADVPSYLEGILIGGAVALLIVAVFDSASNR